MDWLDSVKREALSKVRGAYYGADGAQELDRRKAAALRGVTGTYDAGAGLRPDRNQFLTTREVRRYEPGMENSRLGALPTQVERRDTELVWNEQAWLGASAQWMRGQEDYKDWSDSQIKQFLYDTRNMTDEQRSARELWMSQKVAFDKAQKEAEADRTRMLAELETFKAGYGNEWMNGILASEKTYWEGRTANIVSSTIKQVAAMGRIANPYMLSQVARLSVAQGAAALATRRLELEQTQKQFQQFYLTQLNSVLGSTQRKVMDPATAAGMVQQAGKAAA